MTFTISFQNQIQERRRKLFTEQENGFCFSRKLIFSNHCRRRKKNVLKNVSQTETSDSRVLSRQNELLLQHADTKTRFSLAVMEKRMETVLAAASSQINLISFINDENRKVYCSSCLLGRLFFVITSTGYKKRERFVEASKGN